MSRPAATRNTLGLLSTMSRALPSMAILTWALIGRKSRMPKRATGLCSTSFGRPVHEL